MGIVIWQQGAGTCEVHAGRSFEPFDRQLHSALSALEQRERGASAREHAGVSGTPNAPSPRTRAVGTGIAQGKDTKSKHEVGRWK